MEIPLFSFSVILLLSTTAASASSSSYYIHCGSASETTDQGQEFTGDSPTPTGVELKAKRSSSLTSSSRSNVSSLYTTARAFTSNASYQFDTSAGAGTYILRLHFFAFSPSDLTSARFNVSSNGHMLLPNFTGSEASGSPVSKEFLIPVAAAEKNLRLYFLPIGSSGVAFVNAIEVIFADLNLTEINSPVMVTPDGGYNGSFNHLASSVLLPVYRVNVGGSNVSASDDTLRRSWSRDDPYLVAGKKSSAPIGPFSIVNYRDENSTVADAPRSVYSTARGWSASSDSNSNSTTNATWSFRMSKGSSNYFIRAHFCDIVSIARGQIVFNLHFFGKFVWKVDAFAVTNQLAAPFCLDFMAKSDDVGFINLTIGRIQGRGGAFLNGLEIMEFVTGSAAEPNIHSRGKKNVAVIVACGFGLVFILVVMFALLLMRKRKRARAPVEEEFNWPLALVNGGSSEDSKATSDKTSMSSLPSLNLRIPIGVIEQVTNNFDDSLVIGQGGFGKVYKGVLKSGVKVAVKRSDSKHGQGLPEFQTEITVLSKIRHRHLVSLIGYCDEKGEMILVYEFMEKGTLRDHLYGSEEEGLLSWKQRLEICIGAAKGLHYLHTGSAGGMIIHRDVKSTNILLDENLVAKVADFGLSRTGGLDQDNTHISTFVKGTYGYLDPEYYQCMQLTEKSDVYSFGVLLLEVLCARQALDTSLPRDQVNLADWAMLCKERGDVEMIVDRTILGQVSANSLNKFVETAEKCLNESGCDRPSMSDVLWDLEYALQLHEFRGQGVGGFGDSATTTEASFNLPIMAFDSTAFSMQEQGIDQASLL